MSIEVVHPCKIFNEGLSGLNTKWDIFGANLTINLEERKMTEKKFVARGESDVSFTFPIPLSQKISLF